MIEQSADYRLDRDATFYVAGHKGLVGSAIVRKLKSEGFTNVVGQTSGELDLCDRKAVFSYVEELRPKYVVLAAAKVGGILANSDYPADFISQNLQIQTNVLDACNSIGVSRLLFLGSSCIYPKNCPQPIQETYLLTGALEETNEAYAIAKIAGLMQVKAIRRQFGRKWISAMPTNLYGPGDNYDPQTSHVIPALIRRYELARRSNQSSVTNWGSGMALREFLFSDDLAAACLHLLENYDSDEHINVGVGRDQSIKDVAEMIARLVGYSGESHWDTSKPDGTPRKVLDVSKIRDLGWKPEVSLEAGLNFAIEEFRALNPEA